jgi:hypothetical protein
MASNLTGQVRGIAKVDAVANGDLAKLTVEARSPPRRDDQQHDRHARDLADQVTTVAREVGVEGKLGGQAKVPGAAAREGSTENQRARRQPDDEVRARRGGDGGDVGDRRARSRSRRSEVASSRTRSTR